MSFAVFLDRLDWERLHAAQRMATPARVAALLRKPRLDDADLPLLVSPAADELLEEMARAAAAVTAHRFGKVIQLYAPLYLSNVCNNDCAYCGFAVSHRMERRTATVDEAVAEADVLWREGFRHVLLVSGEAPQAFSADDLERAARQIAPRFAGIGIEVFPMPLADYRRMERASVDNLTLYQETYDRALYAKLHRGPKADFDKRLAAIELGGEAGFRGLGIGALLGLRDWRDESLTVLYHGRYLAKRFWQSRVAVSFPRLRPAVGAFAPLSPVTDRDLAQMIVATRLALPDAEIVVSTRERAELRDRLIPLGVTRMSAGSKTNVGGYQGAQPSGDQFAVNDERSPQEVVKAITAAGREAVWKDFDQAFRSGTT